VTVKQKPLGLAFEPRAAYTMTPQTARLLDLAADAAVGVDLRSDAIQYWSLSAEKLYGWKRSEVLGKRPSTLLKTIFPMPISEIKRVLSRQGRWAGELIQTRRDGSAIHVRSNWALFQANYRRPIYFEICTDISEQLTRERKVRSDQYDLEDQLRKQTLELQRLRTQASQQGGLLHMAYENLRDLSARLQHAYDDERRRIARELHDGMGQGLALLVVSLSIIRKKAQELDPTLANEITEQSALAKQLSEELRTISYLLHPPLLEEMGLVPAIRCYIEGLEKRTKIRFQTNLPAHFERLPADMELAIFRVVQECLTNIYRHSGSPVAYVQLGRTPASNFRSSGAVREELKLRIADEGRGIPEEKLSKMMSSEAGVGLASVRERVRNFGGQFEIRCPGKGTEVRVSLPWPQISSLSAKQRHFVTSP
jgi:PAS domain S-box-containing protein